MCNSFMSCMADPNFTIGALALFSAAAAVVIVGALVWFEIEDFIEARRK